MFEINPQIHTIFMPSRKR